MNQNRIMALIPALLVAVVAAIILCAGLALYGASFALTETDSDLAVAIFWARGHAGGRSAFDIQVHLVDEVLSVRTRIRDFYVHE